MDIYISSLNLDQQHAVDAWMTRHDWGRIACIRAGMVIDMIDDYVSDGHAYSGMACVDTLDALFDFAGYSSSELLQLLDELA